MHLALHDRPTKSPEVQRLQDVDLQQHPHTDTQTRPALRHRQLNKTDNWTDATASKAPIGTDRRIIARRRRGDGSYL